MKKLITLSTLTAGIGVSAFGLNIHHADAADPGYSSDTPEPDHCRRYSNQFWKKLLFAFHDHLFYIDITIALLCE